MRRYLVVANQTLAAPDLREKVRELTANGPCLFHIVVPATRPHGGAAWTHGQARALASDRLQQALQWFRGIGVEVTGEVGDQMAMNAIADALIAQTFDEIVLSTLPAGISRWLHQDLPNRVRRAFALPVSHVVGHPDTFSQSA